MGKKLWLSAAAVFIVALLFFPGLLLSAVIMDSDPGVEVRCALFSSGASVWLGTNDGVWFSEDGGKKWQQPVGVSSVKGAVSAFAWSKESGLFAAGSGGIYHSVDHGRSWERVYKTLKVNALMAFDNRVFAGGSEGLLFSADGGRHWSKASGRLSSIVVFSFAVSGGIVYLSASDGIYKSSDGGDNWERIRVYAQAPTVEDPDSQDNEVSVVSPVIASGAGGNLYAVMGGVVHISADSGAHWQPIGSAGFILRPVASIAISADGRVYASDGYRLGVYSQGSWQEITLPGGCRRVNGIVFSLRGGLYVLTDNGLKSVTSAGRYYQQSGAEDSLPIAEVQKAAVRAAEAEQSKIRVWRKQAAKRAWLPKVSLGLQNNGTDRWHWEGGSTAKIEDDYLRKGKYSREWSVSLDWDLADVLWSDQQTAIDTRSKLNVELRQDILEQVTRAYFERLRVQNELDNLVPEDRKRRFERELKLRELTAYLDGMTDGLYSRKQPQSGILSGSSGRD